MTRVEAFVTGPFQVNQFVIIDEASRTFAIIDAPGHNRAVDRLLEAGYVPRWIALTHGHIDHIAGLHHLKETLNVPVYLHESDRYLLDHVSNSPFRDLLQAAIPPDPDHNLTESDMLDIGDLNLAVIHTPGHTPGGVCLFDGTRHLFTGDTLFYESVGRTDLPGGDHTVLINSIRQQLLSLPDPVIVHPGHGPDSTIGHERQTNPFI